MSFLDAIILGLVEGITEFLPISSTAHLMMASQVLNLTQTDFLKSFEIVIQLGAIAAVLFMFARRITKSSVLWKKVLLAFLPTAVIGFFLYKVIKMYLIGNLSVAVWSLIIGGLVLIAIEQLYLKHRSETTQTDDISLITNKQAFIIGIVQSLSAIPGISRAAATIIPSLLFGASRKAATEFSFLLAIPTVAAAAGYDLLKSASILTFNDNLILLVTGFIVSFVASLLSVKFLLSYISKHSFVSFGIYRIVIGIIFFFIFVA